MTSFPLHPDTPLTDAQVEALSASPGMDRLLAMVRRDPALCDALPDDLYDALARPPGWDLLTRVLTQYPELATSDPTCESAADVLVHPPLPAEADAGVEAPMPERPAQPNDSRTRD